MQVLNDDFYFQNWHFLWRDFFLKQQLFVTSVARNYRSSHLNVKVVCNDQNCWQFFIKIFFSGGEKKKKKKNCDIQFVLIFGIGNCVCYSLKVKPFITIQYIYIHVFCVVFVKVQWNMYKSEPWINHNHVQTLNKVSM